MLNNIAGIALAVSIMVVAAGCSQTDAGITTAVKTRFAADETVKAYQINVDTKNGVVTLSGAVETRAAKDQAARLAREAEGVTQVADNLTVNASAPTGMQGAAYAAGYERGRMEGRKAGREERVNKRKWDLEGQSELDAADSGYQPGIGSKADYQVGYREGFRLAYRAGWDQTN